MPVEPVDPPADAQPDDPRTTIPLEEYEVDPVLEEREVPRPRDPMAVELEDPNTPGPRDPMTLGRGDPKVQEPPKPVDTAGEFLKATRDQAPKLMMELMCEYIEKRDLNERVQVKMRMKALLDLFGVDTVYPTVASIEPKRRDPGMIYGGAPALGDYGLPGGRPQNIPIAPGDAVQAIPGAEPIGLNNNDITGVA